MFNVAGVYPVVNHWVWSDSGWASMSLPKESLLFHTGVLDLAGCSVVHIVGGTAALVAIFMLGSRTGRYDADGNLVEMPQQSATHQTIGMFLLWTGWYGFNAGKICGGTLYYP